MEEIENLWVRLGCRQMDAFENDPVSYRNLLVTGMVIRELMLQVYKSLVMLGLMLRIEDADSEEKNAIWSDAKELAAGRLLQEQIVELAKCLYTIKCFLTK